MLYVDNQDINDPRTNLAIEERLMRDLETEQALLMFYINEPSVIIGRNQNTLEEINRAYVQKHGIHVVRRLSGGGAVYHDFGNLNFSFITRNTRKNFHNFRKFAAPVIHLLNELGAPAEMRGASDIVIEGRKVSGNAQYATAKRLVTHGTLLFDSDLSQVEEALRVGPGRISSKSVKSVRSRVTNILGYLERPMDIQAFRQRLLQEIFKGENRIPRYMLSAADWSAVHKLEMERYRTWEWNYGRSPDFNVQKVRRFGEGEIEVRIDVQKGEIHSIHFTADFFTPWNVSALEAHLEGVRYDAACLEEALDALDVGEFFPNITKEELLRLIY
jgi:lipoate-protein ligase A